MNELELYVDSLDPSLSNDEKVRLVEQWKKDNNWGQDQVEVETTEVEEVKKPAVAEKDTPVTAETTEVSEDLSSGSGISSFIETDNPIFSWQKQIQPKFYEKAPSISDFETYRKLVTGLKPGQAGEGEIIKGQGDYEYKYEIDILL